LDTLQAAVLRIKLQKLDAYIAARNAGAAFYDKAFENHPHITTPFRAGYSRHVFHQYTLKLDAKENIAAFRNGLQEYLASKQIPSMIYYPVPAHRQKMFAAFGSDAVALPITDWLTDRVISLPMHTELSEAQLQYIAQEVLTYMNT